MKTDDITRMAEQAGLPEAWISETGVLKWSDLERFFKLAYEAGAAAERNACLAEFMFGRNTAEIKSAIRARGNT